MARIDWRRTRDISISILCIGIILWAAWNIMGQFVDVIVILVLSLAIAFLLTPIVNFFNSRRIPRVVATLLAYIIVLGVLSIIGYGLVSTLIQQAIFFATTIRVFALDLPQKLNSFILFLQKQGHVPDENIKSAIGQFQGQVTAFAQSLASNALNFVLILTNASVNIFLILVISFYLIVDGGRIRDGLISIVPRRSLPNVMLLEDALSRVVGKYIRGQLSLAVIVGLLTGLVCIAFGLRDFALICAILAFIFETIPMVGPVLASITPLLLSLLLPNPLPRTIWIAASFVLIQVIESNILGPRIVGHAVGLHPIAAILALLVGAKMFGIFGALLATPVVAALWVVVASIYRSARGETSDQLLAKKRAPWSLHRHYTSPQPGDHNDGPAKDDTLEKRVPGE